MTGFRQERGQSIILTAFLFLGLATFGFFLVINANDLNFTFQGLNGWPWYLRN